MSETTIAKAFGAIQHPQSIFTRLPPELRLVIYEDLLVRPEKDVDSRRWRASTQILRTCKQILAEAEPVLYAKFHVRVKLSVKDGDTPSPRVFVKTFHDNVLYRNTAYPRGFAYRSSAWFPGLRKARYVSIAIELEQGSLTLSRLARNHALASLLLYIDAASDTTKLHLRLLGNTKLSTSQLERILHPVCTWGRRMPDVKLVLINLSPDLRIVLRTKINDMAPTLEDDAIEQLFSIARIAARAATRLEYDRSLTKVSHLNNEMAKILAKVGFIESGCQVRAEAGITEIKGLIRRVLERL